MITTRNGFISRIPEELRRHLIGSPARPSKERGPGRLGSGTLQRICSPTGLQASPPCLPSGEYPPGVGNTPRKTGAPIASSRVPRTSRIGSRVVASQPRCPTSTVWVSRRKTRASWRLVFTPQPWSMGFPCPKRLRSWPPIPLPMSESAQCACWKSAWRGGISSIPPLLLPVSSLGRIPTGRGYCTGWLPAQGRSMRRGSCPLSSRQRTPIGRCCCSSSHMNSGNRTPTSPPTSSRS